ncbi:MAG: AAA family ATPase [Planctomycetota bacterium]
MTWRELAGAPISTILDWAEPQPWARAMAACAQDPEWHSEGDVWTHTRMVCAQLTALEEWASLSENERTMLAFTALLHDAAKPLPSRTDRETGRIISPQHAVRGEHLARGVLRDLGCDLATRESIARLVRYHGRPAFLAERADPAHEVVRLSHLVSNRLLHLFAIADLRGRDTDSGTRSEDDLHLWRLVAEEHGCHDRPYAFASDHARFVFCRSDAPSLFYVPHEAHSCTVTMMCGLPGSGKDTWLARNRPGLPTVSLDDLREELDIDPTDEQGAVMQAARERCREFLRARTSFAFNATNVVRRTRRRWIDLFADYGARVELVYLEPPLERILIRNRSRAKRVPEQVMRDLAAKCEPPTLAECHALLLDAGIR